MKAVSLCEFMVSPIGHYCATPHFVFWYPHPAINGFSLRGAPNAGSIRELTQIMEAMLKAGSAPLASLIDARALTHADPAAFSTLATYVGARSRAFRAVIRRQALVRPVGMLGAVVAGFYQVLTPSFPVAVFDALDDALGWLGPSEAAHARRALEAIDNATCDPALLSRLRQRLAYGYLDLTCPRVARELGVSERTLQRRLHAAGTSFHDELVQARIRAAQRLMLSTEASLTEIALEVGCASLQHYSSLFRKIIGESPSTWRKARQQPSPQAHDHR